MDKFAVYVVPRISIDGAERYLTTPHSLRSSTRYWPYAEKLPGFHREDVNNDGEILMMRKEDPLGDWKVSKLDPRIMDKRGIDEFDIKDLKQRLILGTWQQITFIECDEKARSRKIYCMIVGD